MMDRSVDVDAQLLARAHALTSGHSNQATVEFALRRLIASKQKTEMVDGIAGLTGLANSPGEPEDN